MLLEKQLILPFNYPIKNANYRFKKDFYDWNIIFKKIEDKTFVGIRGLSSDIINLANISHQVIKLYVEDDAVYADIKILDSYEGTLLQNFILNDIELIFRFNIMIFDIYTDTCKYNLQSINVILDNYDYFDLTNFYRMKKIKQLLK